MVELFEKLTGARYPYERYAQVFVWDFLFGGMENATATTLNMRALHGPETEPNYTAETLVAHELAHQWYGDLITCRTWHHIWLNEGFATYFADLWFEHSRGPDEFRLRRYRSTEAYREETPETAIASLAPDPRGDRPVGLSGGHAYSRGAAVLHLLRHELGDRAFFAGLRDYTKRHADSAVTTEEFRRCMERAAGRSLGTFFDQWIYDAGYPRLDVGWRWDGERKQALVTVRQTQEGAPFRFTLPLVLHRREDAVETMREVFDREHEFAIASPVSPVALRVDPEEWLLAEVTVEQGFPAWSHLAAAADPIGRIRALHELIRFGSRGEADVIRALRTDAFRGVREAAARELGKLPGSAAAVTALGEAARDRDPRVREAAWRAFGDPAEEEILRAVEEETHPYVRAAIAAAAGRAKLASSFAILEGFLAESSHREVIREGAMEGFRALGDPRALSLVRPYLDYRWGGGRMSRMRKAALDVLLALDPDGRETRKVVLSLLADPYFRMRAWAAEACGTYGIRASVRALENMSLTDRHWGPRRAAREALTKLRSEE
jgi:aminopeptidase N